MFIITLLQMIGLNFMLIIMTLGFIKTSIFIYIVWTGLSILVTLNSQVVYNAILNKTLDAPRELQFIPVSFAKDNLVSFACSNAIHIVLAYTLLNSIFIPTIMILLLLARIKTARVADKVMKECLR